MLAGNTEANPTKANGGPFWERFKAWWNGYELSGKGGKLNTANKSAASHDVRYDKASFEWETARLRLVQEVWGEGFATPGGAEHVRTMVKYFALNPAMSVLDLGAGLGGATRTMSTDFGVWVTGIESSKELAEAGMALSVMAGMGKKAAVSHFDPTNLELKAKSIDCVFSKEFLFTIDDKPTFLRSIENIMKPRGQLLFTDLVLAQPGQSSKALSMWKEFEPETPHVWAVQDYKQALAELHLDIRVVENMTEQYHKMVTKAWGDYIKLVKKRGVAPEDSIALVNEVELWSRRIQAIDSGDLQVTRIHALKKDTNRLMSSW